jgi:EmrB/QacA subfamily drug resistance transporter
VSAHDSYADLTTRQVAFTVGGMMLTLLLAAMDQTIVGTAMPRVIASLDGFDRYPWVTTAYLLSSTVAVPVFAKLSDLYGRKWLYLGSAVLFIVSSWLCGAAGNLPLPLDGMNQLIAARGLQGVGGGGIMGLTFTIIGDLFAPAERGRFQGLFGGVFGLASVIGPLAGGWITDNLSWRWAFYVNAPLGILAVAVLYVTFPHVRPHRLGRGVDWKGIVALIAWIVPLLLALSEVNTLGWAHPVIVAALVWTAVALAAFVAIELRAPEPLLPPALFRIRSITLAVAAVFLMGMGLFGMFLYLPLYLQAVLGLSAEGSGRLFTPLVFAMVLASIVSGQVVSRTGRYKALAVLGAALAAIGMLLLTRMDRTATSARIVANLIVLGVGFGLVQPIFTLVVQNAAPREYMGSATASSQFFRSIGSTIGVAIFGTVLLTTYHRGLDAALPEGTPPAVAHLFENPLELAGAQSEVAARMAATPDAARLVPVVLAATRDSLDAGMHRIFAMAAAVIGLTVLLTVFLPELPLRRAVPRG